MNKSHTQLGSLHIVKSHAIAFVVTCAILAFALFFLPSITNAASTVPLCEITRNLKVGDVGEDVNCLQRYLNWSGFTVSASGVGSPGNESSYFGSLTANAVVRWQNANALHVLVPAGLSSGTGFWGPLSFGWYVSIVNTLLRA